MGSNVDYICQFHLVVPELTYRSSAKIELYIETLDNIIPRVYDGSSRANLTDVVEGNAEASIGAPYSVPVDDGMQLYMKAGSSGGSMQVSFKVVGEAYPWWEKMFLGRKPWVYYFGLSAFCILFFCCCFLPCCQVSVVLSLAPILCPSTLIAILGAVGAAFCCCRKKKNQVTPNKRRAPARRARHAQPKAPEPPI